MRAINPLSPFRQAVQMVTGLGIGDRATVANDRLCLVRTAAGEHGVKLTLIERRDDGLAVIQRVEKTRWGVIKARVSAMQIGDSITAPASKRESFHSAARQMGMHLRTEQISSTILLLTRVEQSVRAHYGEAKQIVADLPVGCALADQEIRRSRNLCVAGKNLGYRMSRRRQPDGNYTVRRLA